MTEYFIITLRILTTGKEDNKLIANGGNVYQSSAILNTLLLVGEDVGVKYLQLSVHLYKFGLHLKENKFFLYFPETLRWWKKQLNVRHWLLWDHSTPLIITCYDWLSREGLLTRYLWLPAVSQPASVGCLCCSALWLCSLPSVWCLLAVSGHTRWRRCSSL